MDADRDLLFGLIAFQAGAIDADQLAETCAELGTVGAADALAAGGALTDEQRDGLRRLMEDRLRRHGGDVQATLAATLDGRSLDVLRAAAPRAIHAAAGAAPGPDSEAPTIGTAGPVGRVLISSRDDPAREPEEEARDPRYTLTHLHAKGGMGQVWRARDASLGREIALKELRPESAGDSIVWSRFLYEARVTARLEHPGVVPVYEMGGGESPYYTMRFVKGRTLNEAVRAYHKARVAGTADDVDRVRLLTAFVAVCHAIDYAHSRGIIHRDLKGQNVVLGDYGEVIVLDWGLAKQIGDDPMAAGEAAPADAGGAAETMAGGVEGMSTLAFDPAGPDAAAGPEATLAGGPTLAPDGAARDAEATIPPWADTPNPRDHASPSTPGAGTGVRSRGKESGAGPEGTMQGQLLGTPAYMAPEQARGQHDRVDFRTDVYGLGAILYEILAGHPPFLGKKTAEILYKVVHEAPAPPRAHNPQAPPDLQAACLKALSKDRDGRYQTAGELAKDVQRHLADEPVTAYDEPWTRRAARWSRKHRTAVAAAAVLLVVSTAASAIGTVVVEGWRDEAEAQGALARGTVNDMYGRLGESWLEDRLDPIQKEFLEKTIAFYEGQTARASADPAVQMEHAEMLRRMGNVYAKFGRRGDAESAYGRAEALLRPLLAARKEAHEPRRVLASTLERSGEALFRDGSYDPAAARLAEAEDLIRPLASPDFAQADDRRLLARTLRWKGQLLRRRGDLAAAGPAYVEARDLMEKALAAEPGSPEVVGELAQSLDFLARLGRDKGDEAAGEASSRRGYELLDKLVAEFPTVPRHREGLHHACAELGWFAHEAGRMGEAETLWGRSWREASRLVEDYPDRPEYAVNLAGASTNYGGLLAELARYREAEPILKKAIALNEGSLEKSPGDGQVRFNLAKCRSNYGFLLLKRNRAEEAVAELEKAVELNGKLAADQPDVPRNAHFQATYLQRLGEALDAAGRPGSTPAYERALETLKTLADRHPGSVPYRFDLALCLMALGAQKDAAGAPKESAGDYEAALARLEGLVDASGKPAVETLRQTSIALNNLASARQAAGEGDAEGPVRRAIAISEELCRREAPAADDLRSLALARVTLAETLQAKGEAAGADPLFAQAAETMKAQAEAAPADPLAHFYLGYILIKRASDRQKPEDERAGLVAAVDESKQAVELTLGKNPTYRTVLGDARVALVDVLLKQSAYEEARKVAMEVPRDAVEPTRGCLAGARLLAHLAAQARGDARLDSAQKAEAERKGLSGAVLLLREALDADPRLLEEIKQDPAFKELLGQTQYQILLGSSAGAGDARK